MRIDSDRIACKVGIRPTASYWSGLNFQIQSARPSNSSAISVEASGTWWMMIFWIAGMPLGLSG